MKHQSYRSILLLLYFCWPASWAGGQDMGPDDVAPFKVYWSDSILFVEGTDIPDNIAIQQLGEDTIRVAVAVGPMPNQWTGINIAFDSFEGIPIADAVSIRVYGNGAGDNLINQQNELTVLLDGGPGDDNIVNQGDVECKLLGNDGNDTIQHLPMQLVWSGENQGWVDSTKSALLYGGAGDDVIVGGAGNDRIYGGSGYYELNGGPGNDLIEGDGGRDVINGGPGNDSLSGGFGLDRIMGGPGHDRIYALAPFNQGGSGHDVVFGDEGNDHIYGSAGDNYLVGGPGNDHISGVNGNDLIYGNEGDDTVRGGDGNDVIFGNLGQDVILGESGNDHLHGGSTDGDFLYGGQGHDEMMAGGVNYFHALEHGGDVRDFIYVDSDGNGSYLGRLDYLDYIDRLFIDGVLQPLAPPPGRLTIEELESKFLNLIETDEKFRDALYKANPFVTIGGIGIDGWISQRIMGLSNAHRRTMARSTLKMEMAQLRATRSLSVETNKICTCSTGAAINIGPVEGGGEIGYVFTPDGYLYEFGKVNLDAKDGTSLLGIGVSGSQKFTMFNTSSYREAMEANAAIEIEFSLPILDFISVSEAFLFHIPEDMNISGIDNIVDKLLSQKGTNELNGVKFLGVS